MFKANKRTLTAAVVIAAALAPSTAYARVNLNPSPLGAAIGQTQAQSAEAVVRPNPDQQTPVGRSIAGFAYCPRVGPCVSPDTVLTQGSAGHSESATAPSSHSAFRWTDAEIGAAAMLLLIAAGGAAVVATRRMQHRVTPRPGIPAS